MHFSLGAKIQGKLASSFQPLLVWWLGFLVFIQVDPGSTAGQGFKISLLAATHCCLTEITATSPTLQMDSFSAEPPQHCCVQGLCELDYCHLKHGLIQRSIGRVALKHIHYRKIESQREFAVWHRELILMLCDNPERRGGGEGWWEGWKGGTYVCIPVARKSQFRLQVGTVSLICFCYYSHI